SVRQLRRRRPQEGPDQPGRREDQRGGDREPDPLAPGRAERRVRAHARPGARRAHVRVRGAAPGPARYVARDRRAPHRGRHREVQATRAPGADRRAAALAVRQGLQGHADEADRREAEPHENNTRLSSRATGARLNPRSREYGTMWTDTIRTTPPSSSQHASRNQSRRSPSAATIVTPRGSAFDAVAGLITRRGGSRTTSVARPPTRQSQLPKTRKVLRQPSHSMSPAATGPAMMKLTLKPDSTRARTRLR